jgi:hypothetical protein
MNDLTAAFGEKGVEELFNGVVKNFVFEKADSTSGGRFTAGYDVKAKLEGGTISLTNQNTVKISELDIRWLRIKLKLTVDIPKICTPDGCVDIFGKEICIPQWCIFEANPDIDITFDLSTFIRHSEVSGEVSPLVRYFINPARPANMGYLEAEEAQDPALPNDPKANLANKWQVFLDPIWLDVDLIDFEATVEELLTNLVETLVDTVFSGFPGWAKDAILAISGPIIDLIGSAIDLVDDFQEWLADFFNVSIGLGNLLLTLLADTLANKNPILSLEDPLKIMDPTNTGLIPVKIPISALSANVNSAEMVVAGTVGANLGG